MCQDKLHFNFGESLSEQTFVTNLSVTRSNLIFYLIKTIHTIHTLVTFLAAKQDIIHNRKIWLSVRTCNPTEWGDSEYFLRFQKGKLLLWIVEISYFQIFNNNKITFSGKGFDSWKSNHRYRMVFKPTSKFLHWPSLKLIF